jgi:hypothetical protein
VKRIYPGGLVILTTMSSDIKKDLLHGGFLIGSPALEWGNR